MFFDAVRHPRVIELLADGGEHILGHRKVLPAGALVDREGQVGGIARLDVEVVERGALVQPFGEPFILLDGLAA